MSLLTKAMMALGVGLLCITQLQSQTVTILESQNIHPLQDMDQRWESACNTLGYSSSIVSYDFLNQSCLAELTDVLIISSAVAEVNPTQISNLESFVESGGTLYIQGEYLDTFSGNELFLEMINHFGDSFTWGASGNQNVGPLGVGSSISNNYNTIDSLEYFWYGLDGSGVGPFTSILSKDDKNYGYLYEPNGPYNGKIYCTTDQDWIRLDYGNEILENIVYSFPVTLDPFPEVIITTDHQNFCSGEDASFQANLNFTIPNSPTPNYQWMINGNVIPGATEVNFVTNLLQDGDVVECELIINYGCKQSSHISNGILMSPVFPISTSSIEMEILQLNGCAQGTTDFEVNISNPNGININSIEWIWNNIVLSFSTSSTLSINDLSDGDIISIRYSVIDPCYGITWVTADDITVVINQLLEPSISLSNPIVEFCQGDLVNYSITGDHWGSNPNISWLVNGLTSSNTTTNFDASQLSAGQYTIQAQVESSEQCVTTSTVNTSPIVVQVNELHTLAANLSIDNNELCQGALATFIIDPISLGNNYSIEWMVDGQAINFSGLAYQTTELLNNQNVSAVISTNEACYTSSSLDLDPITVIVNDMETPQVLIATDLSKVCKGTTVNIETNSAFLGTDPIYNWYVNGNLQTSQTETLELTIESLTTSIEVKTESDLACLTQSEAESNLVEITTAPMELENLVISPEHCGQSDGAIYLNIAGGFGLITSSFSLNQNELAMENISAGEINFEATDSIGCTFTKSFNIPEALGPKIEDLKILQPDCGTQVVGTGNISVVNSDDVSIYWMDENDIEVATGTSAYRLAPGNYYVEVLDDFGCITNETFEIENVLPVHSTGDQEFLINLGENLELNPNAISGASDLTYVWEGDSDLPCTDCETLKIEPTESSRYIVTISNETGCTTTASYLVKVRKNYEVYLPNAFSPNGDGNNDSWTVFVGDEVASVNKISIFNRWGAVVFQSTDVNMNVEQSGWNGLFKNKIVQEGVYMAMVEVTFKDGESKVFNGDIAVIR